MIRAVCSEWTKLRSLPSGVWSLVAVAALMVGGGAAVILITDVPGCATGPPGCGRGATAASARALSDTAALLLSGVHLAQIAAVAAGVALSCGEYQPRLLRTTLAMHPRRPTVFTAKAIVVGAAVLTAAAVGVGLALLAGRPLLEAHGLTPGVGYPPPDLGSADLRRAAVGTALYVTLIALLALGIGAVLRHAGAAIGATLTLLYGPYVVTLLVPMSATALHRVQSVMPMSAGLAVQTTVAGTGTAPLSPWAGLAVLGVYAASFLLLGAALVAVRDA
ncbi:ABC transporter permease [Dactylosporangium sucinum]|uniref:ABC transporter n=1 Tax=Dactylosporangium sucinum TaxID=1424081 RepID=A0A917TQA4_9ACTN|nr:hypothetical protein [Dactylosporangium sucinum]GGM31389.1 ABC transporter [Dactylosporangium sucinum]